MAQTLRLVPKATSSKSAKTKGALKKAANQPPSSKVGKKQPTLVVAIGASAGGTSALQRFFSKMPSNLNVAFVVAQHFDTSGTPLAVRGLKTFSKYPVSVLSNGSKLSPNRIYVVPAHSLVTIKDGAISLKPARTVEQKLSMVDRLLQMTAKTYGRRSVGIVLSGEASDGTQGLKSINDAGGLSIVQDPEDAEHKSMPESAIASGLVDHILPPEEMTREIVKQAKYLASSGSRLRQVPLEDQIAATLSTICEKLQKHRLHDFGHYKASTLIRRIQRRMQVLRIDSAQRYLDRLDSTPSEAEALFNELLINVTQFFRDPETFETLRSKVLEKLLSKPPEGGKVRLWVPGVSTGEEAYTIAILCCEILESKKNAPLVQIIATDIDDHALSVARKGSYPTSIAKHISPKRLEKYFSKRGGRYHVSKEIREICLFSVHNLITDPPFSQIDLISCRNLLIYLGNHLQKKLFPLFHYSLRSGGYLLLGSSETLTTHKELFKVLDSKNRIAQRKSTAIKMMSPVTGTIQNYLALQQDPAKSPEIDINLFAQRVALDELGPKYVVVNDEAQILTSSPGIAKYIEVSDGPFHNNVVRMAKPSLRAPLRTALNLARREKKKVFNETCTLKVDDHVERVGILVQPMPRLGEDSELYWIAFQYLGTLQNSPKSAAASAPVTDFEMVDQLEHELGILRESLDKTVQDLEASNEELKSSNEELLSMNEELQSANEELESSKEEVQHANEALQRANSDLENLLASTSIATLFLDDDLRIRGFTPAVQDIFNIEAGDVGRKLTSFTTRVASMPQMPDPKSVLDDHKAESEINMPDGRVLLRRIRPYQNYENVREGIVVTFIDVTEIRGRERELRSSKDYLRASIDSMAGGFYGIDRDGVTTVCNDSFLKMFGFEKHEDVIGKNLHDVIHKSRLNRSPYSKENCPIFNSARTGIPAHITDQVFFRNDGSSFPAEYWTLPIVQDGELRGAVTTFTDITERKQTQEALAESAAHLQMALAAGGLGTFYWNFKTGKANWSEDAYRHFGFENERPKVTYELFLSCVHPEDRESVKALVEEAAVGAKPFRAEFRTTNESEEGRWILEHGQVFTDSDGQPSYMLGTIQDITDRKRAQIEFERSLDVAPAMLWISNHEGQCKYLSKQWLSFTGQKCEDGLGEGWIDTIHPDDKDRFRIVFFEKHDEVAPFEIEYRVWNVDGTFRWILNSAAPRFDKEGKFNGFAGAVFDIHDRKSIQEARERAIKALVASDERYLFASRATNDAIWDWDLVTNDVHWNEAVVRVLGYDESVKNGNAAWWYEHIHPDDRERVVHSIHESIDAQDTYWHDEYRFAHANGSYRLILDRGYIARDSSGKAVRMIGAMQDFTEQKAVESELRESQLRYRTLVDVIPQLVWTCKSDGQCDYLSKQWIDYTGLPESEQNGFQWLDKVIHPDDRKNTEMHWFGAIEKKHDYDIEYRIRRHDGEYRWFKARGTPVYDDAGQVVQWFGTCTDVHDQKIASETLRLSEERYRVLIEVSPQIVWMSKPDGAISYLNQVWYNFTGHTTEQSLGNGWVNAIQPEHRARVLTTWLDAANAGQEYEVEIPFLNAHDGTYRWHIAKGLPVKGPDGSIERWVGVAIDQHERKVATDRIRASEALLKSITDNTASSLFMMDEKGHPTFMNPAAEKLTGYRLEDISDKPLHYAVHYKKPDGSHYPMEECPIDNAQAELKPLQNQDEIFVDKVGRLYPVSYSVAPLENDGKVIGSVLEFRDISDTKRVESELRLAKDEAERASLTKTVFLANMSHEIRTPLAAILGFSDLLKGHFPSDKSAEQYLERISRNANQLGRLIDELLDLSKIEADRLEVDLRPIPLAPLIDDVMSTISFKAREKALSIEVEWLTDQPEHITTDPVRYRQILANLLGNAVKFTDEGKVRVEFQVEGMASRRELVTRVIDTGIGLTDEQRLRIFEPFMQGDPSVSRRFGGTGLGLALSKKLALLLGGNITLERSSPGQGSIFTARIAIGENGVTSNEPDIQSLTEVEGVLADKKILIVDDSPDNRTIVSLYLRATKAHLSTANDGVEAFAAIKQDQFDLILMDIQMPNMDGYQALRKMKDFGIKTPVIALTAHAFKEERDRSLAAGFTSYLSKPVSKQSLLAQVLSVLKSEAAMG